MTGRNGATVTGDAGLDRFNALADADERLAACCAAPAWVAAVAAGRPYRDRAALLTGGTRALSALDWRQVAAALAGHPRIGRPVRGDGTAAAWSAQEQRVAAGGAGAELAAANDAYERRFGHVFLICATGLSAAEILAALRERLGNDPAAERDVVRDELAGIARLRLGKLLDTLAEPS